MERCVRATRAGSVLGSGVRERPGGRGTPAGMDAERLTARLEAAGAALLALSVRGYSTALRQPKYDIVRSALDAYGYEPTRVRAPSPDAAAISAMDETYGWLGLIPESRYVLRRILGARSLVHPITGRHLFPWRRLATALGADHKSIQRWHGEGLGIILAGLRG